MKIKDTLNLLKTDFSMRANLSEKEPKMQKNWDDKQLYEKMLERNRTIHHLSCMMVRHMRTGIFILAMP